jgi:hypothetical protein
MAIKYFTANLQSNISKGEIVYEAFDSNNIIGDSDIFMFPDNCGKINHIAVKLDAILGKANLMWTLSSRDKVIAGTAQWYVWDQGLCDGTAKTDIIAPVTAIMKRNVSGNSNLEAVAQ